jgi:hypothetical protein
MKGGQTGNFLFAIADGFTSTKMLEDGLFYHVSKWKSNVDSNSSEGFCESNKLIIPNKTK